MSASPTKARLGVPSELLDTGVSESQISRSASSPEVGHEALQALLAFSALHEQIRQRRAREVRSGVRWDTSGWEVEQFVLDEVLQLVAERALTITGADGVAIALAEGDEIVCRASAGTIAPDSGVRLDPNSGFSGACLRSGQIVRCDDVESDSRVNVEACRRLGARSMMAVPLAGQHSVLGLLEAFSSEPYGFNDSDVRSLNLLAELILAAMRPEEEDRLAEIAQRVTARAARPSELPTEPRGLPAQIPASEKAEPRRIPVPFAEPTSAPVPTLATAKTKEKSRPGIAVVLVLVLFAMALGGGLWWKIRRNAQPATTTLPRAAPTSPRDAQPVPEPSNAIAEGESTPTASAVSNLTGLPQVTGIRHWSSVGSSTVVIDLQNQVQYEAHRLSDPERIYFDLHDTNLAPGLFGKTIEVGDALLLRVRVAQPVAGVTRVVLETKGGSGFSVSLESNPYRLVVEVRKVGSEQSPAPKTGLVSPVKPEETRRQASAEPKITGDTQTRAHLPKFRIALDAGHGGWDLGTVGRKGLLEKDLVLDIVERLGNLVEHRLGAEVIYTRNDDNYVALEKRAEIANLAQADLFLSVHANYSNSPSARGVETYYSNTYSSLKARSRTADDAQADLQSVSWTKVDIREKVLGSRRIAASVQQTLHGMLAAKSPGIRNRGVKEASYVVLTGTSMPAILAEVSFVSSPADETKLQSSTYRQQIAEALYKGISRYEQESHSVKMASTSGKPTGQ